MQVRMLKKKMKQKERNKEKEVKQGKSVTEKVENM
jgi:hypothetical protein